MKLSSFKVGRYACLLSFVHRIEDLQLEMHSYFLIQGYWIWDCGRWHGLQALGYSQPSSPCYNSSVFQQECSFKISSTECFSGDLRLDQLQGAGLAAVADHFIKAAISALGISYPMPSTWKVIANLRLCFAKIFHFRLW